MKRFPIIFCTFAIKYRRNSMINEEDYFIAANSVRAINEEQYKNLDVLIRTAEAISRSLYQSVYLIDYYKKGFLYVSENPLFLCGHTSKEMKELGYSFYSNMYQRKSSRCCWKLTAMVSSFLKVELLMKISTNAIFPIISTLSWTKIERY